MDKKQFRKGQANIGCTIYAAVTIFVVIGGISAANSANQAAADARLMTQWYQANLRETKAQIVAGPTQTAFWATAGPKATQTAAQIELQEQATSVKMGPTQTHFWQTAGVLKGPYASSTADMATLFRLATQILAAATQTAVMDQTSTAIAFGTFIP